MMNRTNAQQAREQYREHNLRLAQTLGSRRRHQRPQPLNGDAHELPDLDHDQLNKPPAPQHCQHSMPRRRQVEAWRDDLYRDFESIYASLCETKPRLTPTPTGGRQELDGQQDRRARNWSREATRETLALDRSLADVERALRDVARTSEEIDATYKPAETNSPQPSEQASCCRADSRNTEQSLQLNGPALVEEMTLSDLEEEISSTLMAAKDAERQRRPWQCLLDGTHAQAWAHSDSQRKLQLLEGGEQLLNGRRSRQPISSAIATSFSGHYSRQLP